jgi:beta-lactamase regulating signal transducer with metallopeptidase domain
MTAAWMLYLLGVGTLLAIAGRLLASAVRHFGHSVRFVHAAALASVLVLAVFAPRRELVESTMRPATVTTVAPAASAVHESTLMDRARALRTALDDATGALSEVVRRWMPPPVARIALIVWTSVSAALLVLFVVVNWRLSLARRAWESRSVSGTPVRVTPDVGPAVIGLLRAEIVIPHWMFGRPDEEQRLVLAHEREHLRARDNLLLAGAWLAAIALPWHPAVWYLVDRIRLAIELDCDVRVLRGGASERSYGALLIDMAARKSAVRFGALAIADGPSHLERRIRAMHWRRGRLDVPRGLVLAAAGGLLVLVACEAKVPTAAEVASMDVGALEKKAAQLDRADSGIGKADYFVNGAQVSADSARAIVAAKIGSVGVMKARSAGGRDTIQITTVDRMPSPQRTDGDDDLLPLSMRGSSSSATLMIDGVVQPPGVRVRQDPKEIAAIQVMKPGKDPKYPNGLIAIETKRASRAEAERQAAGKVTVTRTDTFIVRSAKGLAAASRSLSDSSSSVAGRTVLLPDRDSANAYRFGVSDIERARVTAASATPVPSVPRMTFDSTKPFAIQIDGVPATRAELDAVRKSGRVEAMTMWVRDARHLSSDPAAANGLMQVRTKGAAKQ